MDLLKRKGFLLSILLVTVIILLSFRTYSAFFIPRINSDQAIHVLMANALKLPEDLYFWGQNRLGSLVPILGHVLLQLLPIHPALAVSITQYSLLIIGSLAFTSLLKNQILKIVFALIWFLPLAPFNELVVISQPYGPQLALIGVAVALTDWLLNNSANVGKIKRTFLLISITASLMLSIWVSDFSLVTTAIFIGVLIASRYQELLARSPIWQRLGLSPINLLTVVLTAGLGFIFISYAKNNAVQRSSDYGTLNNVDQIQAVVGKLSSSFVETISFNNGVALGVHALLAIGFVSFAIYLIFKSRKEDLVISRWVYLFLINAGLGMVILILLEWVYKNGVNLRYFSVVYVSLWLAALLFANSLSGKNAKKLTALLMLLAIVSTLSSKPATFSLQRPLSHLQKLAELQTLGAVGFIGDYWTSYSICTVNPSLFNCTPYDKKGSTPCQTNPALQEEVGSVRCRRCIPKVLASDTIYLVKEKWLEQFPDEIQQFRTCLVKTGEPFRKGGYTIAPYQKKPQPSS